MTVLNASGVDGVNGIDGVNGLADYDFNGVAAVDDVINVNDIYYDINCDVENCLYLQN